MSRRRERSGRAAAGGWTWRRVPWRIALGLATASLVAVLLFIGHLGGWGLLDRLTPAVALAALGFGLPVALLASFAAAAPVLRRQALAGRLSRRRAIAFAAAFYGGIVFLWMAILSPGPPPEWMAVLEEAGWADGAVDAVTLAYRHLLTPAAFALYGAVSGLAGWLVAFGLAASAPRGIAG